MAIAIIAMATISILPTVWRDLGEDRPIIVLLLAFAGIAVFTWSLGQLVTLMRRQAGAAPAKRRRVGVQRNFLATAILLAAGSAACAEWSAHLRSRLALNAVNARLERSSGISPLLREEVEMLIGRTAEDRSPGITSRELEATYRWRGVFRTYSLRARYMRADNPRDPRAKPDEGDGRFDRLDWISDVLE
jgi:hypothetical protein